MCCYCARTTDCAIWKEAVDFVGMGLHKADIHFIELKGRKRHIAVIHVNHRELVLTHHIGQLNLVVLLPDYSTLRPIKIHF